MTGVQTCALPILIVAGLGKGFYGGGSFQGMMLSIRPFLLVFAVSGVTLMLGLSVVLVHGIRLISLRLAATRMPIAEHQGLSP